MQFLKVPYELIEDKNITANEFRIYTFLMSRYNSEKECSYPSLEVIADKIGISTRTIIRSIKNLVKLKYLKVTKKTGLYGIYNEYSEMKYLVTNKEENKVPNLEIKIPKPEKVLKGETEIRLGEYSEVHESKIRLVNKHMELTDKQKDLIGEFDVEVLREALRLFRIKKGRSFTFLMSLYSDVAAKNDKEISDDIIRYSMGNIARLTQEEIETRQALMELEQYGVPVY